ncbi:meiotic recombination protein REC114-like [Haemaphysalis longicornis]
MAGASQSYQSPLQIVRRFPLRRYATYIAEARDDTASDRADGTWKELASTDGNPFVMYVTDTDMLLVNQGADNHECVLLLNSKDWVRGFLKGDSILVVSRFHGDNERRFRVEFDSFADKSGNEQCNLCKDLLSQYFPFQDRDEIISKRTNFKASEFFNQEFQSPEVLQQAIKACLQDPSFPLFVKQVDEVLKAMISK